MPEGVVKGNVEYLCQGRQNGQNIDVELRAVRVQKQQAQNLSCERGSNDIGRMASITHSLGRDRHQSQLP